MADLIILIVVFIGGMAFGAMLNLVYGDRTQLKRLEKHYVTKSAVCTYFNWMAKAFPTDYPYREGLNWLLCDPQSRDSIYKHTEKMKKRYKSSARK